MQCRVCSDPTRFDESENDFREGWKGINAAAIGEDPRLWERWDREGIN